MGLKPGMQKCPVECGLLTSDRLLGSEDTEVTLLLPQNQLWCLTHREGSVRIFSSHSWVTVFPSMPYAILVQVVL